MTARPSTTWPPTAELATLARRDRLTRRLRSFFYDRGYLEVETPLLSADTVVDAWIEPIRAEYLADVHRWGEPQWHFLQTSPEFAMKRLLAQGATALFQLCKAFRNSEVGQRHNPEFTIAEWYRVGDDHHAQMTLTESLTREMLCEGQRLLTADALASRDWQQWASAPFERLTYCQAFERYVGLHPLATSLSELAALATSRGLVPPASLQAGTRDDWLNYLLAELIEPELGRDAPVFLYDYPATQSALALTRLDEEGFAVAERFELYIDGIELCNGYHELSDAAVLRERIAQQNSVRHANGLRELPVTTRLLDAMEAGLPPSSGVALGWDRLVMLALGRTNLADVLAFPHPRA